MRTDSPRNWTQLVSRTLIALSVLVLSACASMIDRIVPEPPDVSLVGIELVEASLLRQSFNLTLNLSNPNDQTINIQNTEFSAIINGEEFASGVSTQPISLPPFGDSTVAVRVNSGLLKILENLSRLSSDGLNYTLEGSVKIEGFPVRIPFERTGTLLR